MVMNVLKKIKVQERCYFDGTKRSILIIDCNNCQEKKNNFTVTKNCLVCFFNCVYFYNNRRISNVLFNSQEYEIKFSQVGLFLEYYHKIKDIKKLTKKFETIRKKYCIYDEFGCKVFLKTEFINDLDYKDPISLYVSLVKDISLVESYNIYDSNCIDCLKEINNLLKMIIGLLDKIQIISNFKNRNAKNNFLLKPLEFYQSLFTETFLMKESEKTKTISSKIKQKEDIIDVYEVGKDQLFQITIYNVREEYEKRYTAEIFFESVSYKSLYLKIIQDCLNTMTSIKFNQVIPLERLIKIYKKEILVFLDKKFNNLSNKDKRKIALFVALKRIKLIRLFPLLIDDNIEEIFLDSQNDKIYINHQRFGRCITDLRLSAAEIERLKTFLRIYSGLRLDYTNPSIKFVIKNTYFHCRFAIDIEPLHINNFGLDIRKLNKNIFSIQDLLKNETLSPSMAAFLYFALIHKLNITATGETDSGKTTLINALDLLTPKEFRKIYIENAVESLNQVEFGKHQLKYIVDSLESSEARIKGIKEYSKANQIKILLHRSPDIIYLGEILTKEEANALFHCLAAGLRGFQTIHSKTNDSLLNRLVNFFNIDSSCLNDLDLVVLMKKSYYKRKMISISEIHRENGSYANKLENIFDYIPESQEWRLMKPLYNANVIQKLKKFEDLNEERFIAIMEVYNDVFQHLLKVPRIENHDVVSFFHKLSYFSFKSMDQLKYFWDRWKNK